MNEDAEIDDGVNITLCRVNTIAVSCLTMMHSVRVSAGNSVKFERYCWRKWVIAGNSRHPDGIILVEFGL